MHTRPAVRAGLWTLVAILPWATMAAAIKAALKSAPSSQLLFWSFLFAAPSAFLWDRLLGGRRPATAGLRMPLVVLALGVLGIFGWTAGVILSLDRAPVIEANLLSYLWPLMIVALAPLASERFSGVALAGAVVGFVGAGLLVTEGKGFSVDPAHHLGYALALAAACAWTAFAILLRRRGEPGMRRTPGFVLAAFGCRGLERSSGQQPKPPTAVIGDRAGFREEDSATDRRRSDPQKPLDRAVAGRQERGDLGRFLFDESSCVGRQC